jgi:hypothetical protein
MKIFKRTLTVLALSLCIVAGFGAKAIVSAQTNVQQDINNGLCAGSNLDFSSNPSGDCTNNDSTAQFNNLVHSIINVLSAVVGVVAVVMIIVGGLRYVTSGGNDASVTGAKNTIMYAIIGLVIVALAQIIVRFVLTKVTQA